MRYLVIGTGRCGTLYAAHYLQALGLDIPHERYGKDGTVNWWLGVPWDLFPRPKFDRILHIYREPLATISSLTAVASADHPFWQHVYECSPVNRLDPLLMRCMKHWLYWNALCEAIADHSIAVEQWNPKFVKAFFGIEDPGQDIPKDTHTWKGGFTPQTWEDLFNMDSHLTRLIRRKARRYGYEYPYEANLDSP